MDQTTRSKLYALAASIGALVQFYGLVTQDELARWLDLVSNLLIVVPLFMASYFASSRYNVTKVDKPKHLE